MNGRNFEFDEQGKSNYDYGYPNIIIYQPTNEYAIQEQYYMNDYPIYNDNISNFQNEEKTRLKTNQEDYSKKEDKKNIIQNINNLNLLNNEKFEEITNSKKKCGRKRNRTNSTGDKIEHNKFSDDNIRRKCKHLVLKNLLDFLNEIIKNIYNGNIGQGIFKKELQTLNQSQKSDARINFNKDFITKNLGEIFSDTISGRYTNFSPNHNKILIEKLKNENDENKKIYFNKIFNITFLQCLKHFRGELFINELNGLKTFNQIKDDILKKYPDDGEEYIEILDYYLQNYEEIINNKKARKLRKENKQ